MSNRSDKKYQDLSYTNLNVCIMNFENVYWSLKFYCNPVNAFVQSKSGYVGDDNQSYQE